ncbi:MAG: 50S ribosomal protein L21 [Microbacterium sp.]|nr:MAG: 50S ribosomal protein L21 [Microbacterium sp.]PZU35798.1 MAG: 50S ribosomal protein L21 [Microbacterium sp.]
MVYAVVRAGGRQEKVEVGTVVVLDRQKAKVGERLELPAVQERGPKIVIQKFKNKTGYKKRQGHRQDLTRVKITGIK